MILFLSFTLLLFFFNDTAPTEIYTLSLHDALPIWRLSCTVRSTSPAGAGRRLCAADDAKWIDASSRRPTGASCGRAARDRKSTRLNSSHANISYAVFCLKKKKKKKQKKDIKTNENK